jgi:hypothetical protein
MQIPRHWARAKGKAQDPSGKPYALSIWGWSASSAAEAAQVAERRLVEARARIANGAPRHEAYFYGKTPLREEIVRAIGGEGAAVVTRNRYGALVLNAARVPFIDVDVPEGGGFGLRAFFGKRPDPAAAVLARVREACARSRGASFRIYRTAAGFRVLATDLTLDPGSARTEELLEGFGADPFFTKLCKLQASFRARLTPKPWRCGCPPPSTSYPREDAGARSTHEAWLAAYEAAIRSKATCSLVETVGFGRTSDEARPIVEEHDRECRVEEALPLA